MRAHLLLLLSPAALAGAAPARAQGAPDLPPLPPLHSMHDAPHPGASDLPPWPMPGRAPLREGHRPPPGAEPRLGYSPAERGAWLDACHAGPAAPDCDLYLERYEGRWNGPGMANPPYGWRGMVAPEIAGPGMPYAFAQGMVTPGYAVPPLAWIRVPIMRAQADCGCEEVVEETIEDAAPAPRARRIIERRVVRERAPAGKYRR